MPRFCSKCKSAFKLTWLFNFPLLRFSFIRTFRTDINYAWQTSFVEYCRILIVGVVHSCIVYLITYLLPMFSSARWFEQEARHSGPGPTRASSGGHAHQRKDERARVTRPSICRPGCQIRPLQWHSPLPRILLSVKFHEFINGSGEIKESWAPWLLVCGPG